MKRLGYERYGVQGGDWGSVVGRMAALNDAPHVAGLHLNFCTAGAPPGTADPNDGIPAGTARPRPRASGRHAERAAPIFRSSRTKPQTLGYGLNDSPAGLAAWIVEKFRAWCDCGGDVERKFTKDELLNNVMLYWVTQTITSSTPDLLREPRRPERRRERSKSPSRARSSRRTSSCRPSAGCRRSTTWSAGPRCRAAGTSRRWRSRSCWPRTFERFSGRSGDFSQRGTLWCIHDRMRHRR